MDLCKLSTVYNIRRMGRNDVPLILDLENGNQLYFNYCPPKPSKQSVLNDLKALPEGKNIDDKFYIGFFKENRLVAIMDFIVSFPIKETIYIGLFMMDCKESGQGKGSLIINEVLTAFREEGFTKVRLAYMKGNPQSKRFWEKCGFTETGIERENEHGKAVVLEKTL
ncbi:GNAT family N-acetyltransferase [Granulicatella adiacens]|jgi:acetyltransferase, GNAT family|nr:GNAT family protein [Granulicatella adiacens]UXY40860.1 GNAT family N-acetyltransferase [Granulicatella adiacens]